MYSNMNVQLTGVPTALVVEACWQDLHDERCCMIRTEAATEIPLRFYSCYLRS
jgi:hypothetical protein